MARALPLAKRLSQGPSPLLHWSIQANKIAAHSDQLRSRRTLTNSFDVTCPVGCSLANNGTSLLATPLLRQRILQRTSQPVCDDRINAPRRAQSAPEYGTAGP